jgi:triosephosphate isomerase
MAADAGCQYVLVGHSERRELFGETDEMVAAKVTRVLESGLQAMVCVGETLEERESGDAEAVVCRQLEGALAGVSARDALDVVVAYEPVWAIGTGKTATAEDAQAMHETIRQKLVELGLPGNAMSVLYGGSVKPDNAAALFAKQDIDGGLIGGASLKAEDFIAICQAVVS